MSSYVYTNLVSFGLILKDSFKNLHIYTHNREVISTFICQYSGAPRNTALTLRFFCCFLRSLMTASTSQRCMCLHNGPSVDGAGPLPSKARVPARQWDSSRPTGQGLAALPRMGAALNCWEIAAAAHSACREEAVES